MNTLIIKILIVISLAFGGWKIYDNHNEMVAKLAQYELTIEQMEGNHAAYKRATQEQIDKLKNDVFMAQKATKEAMKLYDQTVTKYEKDKRKLDEKAANLDKLIDDYGLYDPFEAVPIARSDSSLRRQGNVEKADFTLASGSNNQTSNGRLSAGLARYLNTRFKQADEIVLQLTTVQDYAKGQHQWILDNCNAEEAK